jgi:hypothetical protein
MSATLALSGDFPPVQSSYVSPNPYWYPLNDWWSPWQAQPIVNTFTTITMSPKPDKAKELAVSVIREALEKVRDLLDDDEQKQLELALSVLEGR